MPLTKHHKAGERVTAADLRVLRVLVATRAMCSTRYWVEMGCCGHEREMTHKQIDKREDMRWRKCDHCRGKARAERLKERASKPRKRHPRDTVHADYGCVLPLWPAPPLSLAHKGHWIGR